MRGSWMAMGVRGVWLGFVLAVAGLPATAWAYRTSADGDDPEMRGAAPARWESREIEYRVLGDPPPGMPRDAFEAEVRAGVEIWALPDCTSLTWQYQGMDTPPASSEGVTIEVVFSGWDDDGGDPAAAARTDLLYERDTGETTAGWTITGARVLVNADDHTFGSTAEGEQLSLRVVIMHEIGHVIGLLHSCERDGASDAPVCAAPAGSDVMHPDFAGPATLDGDAVDGLCTLYPVPGCVESCGPGLSCLDGECVDPCAPDGCAAEGALGDPCSSSAGCVSRACSPEGFCTTRCDELDPCPAGFECREVAGSAGSCAATDGRYGDTCWTGDDCGSGLCVDGAPTGPVCTRLCGMRAPECPAPDVCGEVEGRMVCHAPLPSGGGCTVARYGGAGRGRWLGGIVALCLLVYGSRRRRR